jgi:hypothetical protein
MAVVFLMGGTGNQLFQFVTSAPNDRFSAFFLRSWVRRFLGWTDHEQIIQYDEPGFVRQGGALVILAFDIVMAKLFGRTFFTALDAKRLKGSPMFPELVRFGYFQTAPERRDLEPIACQIAPTAQGGLVVIHIRGGDLLRLELAGNNVYGFLGAEYYRKGLAEALDDLQRRGEDNRRILILTDDPDYAATFDLSIDGAPRPDVVRTSLKETLELATGADWFISSNSTLSNWIVRLRKGVRSIAPSPFQKRDDIDLPTETRRILVDY